MQQNVVIELKIQKVNRITDESGGSINFPINHGKGVNSGKTPEGNSLLIIPKTS